MTHSEDRPIPTSVIEVLRRPVESAEYTSHDLERELRRHGALASMGSRRGLLRLRASWCRWCSGLALVMTGPAGVLALTCRPFAAAMLESADRAGSDLIGV
ncbi:MAG: hypothetical protein WKF82_13610 [Nocardioidaceae bacterium]